MLIPATPTQERAHERNLPLQAWSEMTVAGLRALADGRMREAAESWLQAATLIDAACAHEAQRAMAQNNAGVALLLDRDSQRAVDCFARAANLWDQSLRRIESAEPELASSSVFHLRLAMTHHETFTALRRGRYLDLCNAGSRIAAFNTHTAAAPQSGGGSDAGPDQIMIAVLSSAFGPNCAEVRILSGAAGECLTAYRDKAASLAERPARTQLDAGLDAGQYLANVEQAAHMSVLLHPGVLSMTAR